jgi:hypothetical protein
MRATCAACISWTVVHSSTACYHPAAEEQPKAQKIESEKGNNGATFQCKIKRKKEYKEKERGNLGLLLLLSRFRCLSEEWMGCENSRPERPVHVERDIAVDSVVVVGFRMESFVIAAAVHE